MPVREQDSIQQRPIVLRKLRRNLAEIAAGNKSQLGINPTGLVEDLLKALGCEDVGVLGKVIQAPGLEVRFADAQLRDFNGPAFVIKPERFGVEIAVLRRRFGGWHERNPDPDFLLASDR